MSILTVLNICCWIKKVHSKNSSDEEFFYKKRKTNFLQTLKYSCQTQNKIYNGIYVNNKTIEVKDDRFKR